VDVTRDLAASGTELPAIMQAGRWKSPAMPTRYAERVLAGPGAVARFGLIFHRSLLGELLLSLGYAMSRSDNVATSDPGDITLRVPTSQRREQG
jgi:hypothetical protein